MSVESKKAATVVLMLSSPEEEVLSKACEALYKFAAKGFSIIMVPIVLNHTGLEGSGVRVSGGRGARRRGKTGWSNKGAEKRVDHTREEGSTC